MSAMEEGLLPQAATTSTTTVHTTTSTSSSRKTAHLSHRDAHAKRPFSGARLRSIDSPAYDASEEDNDPLTDDGSAVSFNINIRPPPHSRDKDAKPKNSSREKQSGPGGGGGRHQLAMSVVSDDDRLGSKGYSYRVDSPTYDGDVESSATAKSGSHSNHSGHSHSTVDSTQPERERRAGPGHQSASSASTLNTPALASAELPPETEVEPASSSKRKFVVGGEGLAGSTLEPAVSKEAQEQFNPAALTTEDIQAFVARAIAGEDGTGRRYKINPPPEGRLVRVYADGVYDLFHFGHALQLRQAKLSFPSVYLLVGVNSDEQVRDHKAQGIMTHAERLEAVRHCRWVDEVVADAPWVIDRAFVDKYKIDYVAHDEDPYAGGGHEDVYAWVKGEGKFIPTRRTPGVSTSELLERIVSGYRTRRFDAKLVKMGREELRAEGSDYDELSRAASRLASRQGSISPSPERGRSSVEGEKEADDRGEGKTKQTQKEKEKGERRRVGGRRASPVPH